MGVSLMLLGLLLTPIPIIIAFGRGHPYRWPITLVTLFVPVVGWGIGMAAACWPLPPAAQYLYPPRRK